MAEKNLSLGRQIFCRQKRDPHGLQQQLAERSEASKARSGYLRFVRNKDERRTKGGEAMCMVECIKLYIEVFKLNKSMNVQKFLLMNE